jgi:predicted dehydrogenase
MKKMKVGVIGVGFIGVAHVEALRRLGFIEVVAIADTHTPQKKANELYIKKGYEDYQEMIMNENLDAVHICTPNKYHYESAMFALQNNIPVLVEKPFTTTLQEAIELNKVAKTRNIVTCLNHSLRMNPQVQQMKSLIENNEVGDIYAVHGSYLQDWLLYDTDWTWRLEPEFSGSTRAFSDIGSHWIDMVENITNQRAVEVLAEFNTVHKKRKKPNDVIESFASSTQTGYEEKKIDTEDWCSILFKFENGAIGSLNVSQITAGRKNQQIINISGSKSSLHWNSDIANHLWIGKRETYNQEVTKDPSLLSNNAKNVTSYPGGHIEGFPDTFKQQFLQFYKAIEIKDYSSFGFSTFEDGYREMLLNERVFQSAQERRWIQI